jgi:hypothetical protein
MYVNTKTIPVEIIPGMGGRREVEGVNSRMIHLIHCKNFCKCHNVPPKWWKTFSIMGQLVNIFRFMS